MKVQLIVLFFTFFLSADLLAQNPTWISDRGSMNYKYYRYGFDGYNEQAYLWQDALLKGDVQSCTISERILDSIVVVHLKYSPYYWRTIYNMEFKYNTKKQLEQFAINHVDIKYESPRMLSKILKEFFSSSKPLRNVRKESFTWVLGQLQTRAYWVNDECAYLINYIYNDAGQIKKEHWGAILEVYQEVYIFPFEVLYDYKETGGYTIRGTLKEDFDSEKGIVKYLLEFNKKGQLVQRSLYSKELRRRKENDSTELATFTYVYNEEGYLTSMTSTNERKGSQTHWYKYIKEDDFGNWQIQQVYDEKKVLLFEMKRTIVYR